MSFISEHIKIVNDFLMTYDVISTRSGKLIFYKSDEKLESPPEEWEAIRNLRLRQDVDNSSRCFMIETVDTISHMSFSPFVITRDRGMTISDLFVEIYRVVGAKKFNSIKDCGNRSYWNVLGVYYN